MLVVSRKPGEKVKISDNITVTVIRIAGGKVKLGFEAPQEIIVDRFEVHERRKREEAA